MNEEEIRSIALFFFFAVPDHAKSVEASSQALAKFRSQLEKNPASGRASLLISSVMTVWQRMRAHVRRASDQPHPEVPQAFVPDDVDVSFWREFRKTASAEEVSAVIWSGILGFNDQAIASALGISEGTVRYRLGKAYGKLGGLFARPKGLRA